MELRRYFETNETVNKIDGFKLSNFILNFSTVILSVIFLIGEAISLFGNANFIDNLGGFIYLPMILWVVSFIFFIFSILVKKIKFNENKVSFSLLVLNFGLAVFEICLILGNLGKALENF